MSRTRQKAQGIFEFAICLALVAASIGFMSTYVRRSLQARYRAVVLYSAKEAGAEHQYEPYYTREKESEDKAKGYTKTGWHTRSEINMRTDASGWEHIPLPKRWTTSAK